jgi:hypothetical protein
MSCSTNPEGSACRRCDGPISIQPARTAAKQPSTRITEQSGSGEGRCAGLKRGARRMQTKECRLRCWSRQFGGLRQRQRRWCGGYRRARQSDNGADGAKIVQMPVLIGTGCGQLLLDGQNRRRGLRRDGMEVAERKRELDGEREQRDPRAKSDVRPHPLHRDNAPLVEGRNTPLPPTLQHNIASAVLVCQPSTPGNNS